MKRKNFWERFIDRDLELILKLFVYDLAETDMKEVSREFIELINIETSSYCNRRCIYCPLSTSDRGQKREVMSTKLFDKILNDLCEIDYKGKFSLNLYNEPLAEPAFEAYLKRLRAIFPKNYISTNSNGDFLTFEKVLSLADCGLNAIYVTLHSFYNLSSYDVGLKAIEKFFDKIRIKDYEIKLQQNEIIAKSNVNGLSIEVFIRNLAVLGNNRAQSVGLPELNNPDFIRKSPCSRVFREVTIDYKGNVYPCCNFYPGNYEYSEFNLGNLTENSLWSIFTSPKLVNFRKSLIRFSPKMKPCSSCSDVVETNDTFKITKNLKYMELLKNIERKV